MLACASVVPTALPSIDARVSLPFTSHTCPGPVSMSSNNPYADSGVVSDSDDDLPPLVDEDGDVYDDSPQLIGSSADDRKTEDDSEGDETPPVGMVCVVHWLWVSLRPLVAAPSAGNAAFSLAAVWYLRSVKNRPLRRPRLQKMPALRSCGGTHTTRAETTRPPWLRTRRRWHWSP